MKKKSSKTIGIIDWGTNSIRFDIYQIGSRYRPTLLYRFRRMVHMDSTVFTKHFFSSDICKMILKIFDDITSIIAQWKIEEMYCLGTSSLREAKNTKKLLKEIHKRTGLIFMVISGDKEAKLIADGVLKYHPIRKQTLLLDLGGGSTEFIFCKSKKVLWVKSIPLGSLQLQSLYFKKHPPSLKNVEKARTFIQNLLHIHFSKTAVPVQSIGSAGTLKALLTLLPSQKNILYLHDLQKLFEKMHTQKINALRNILKTEGQRADIILAGLLIIIECLSFFKLTRILVSKRGLRDGILFSILRHGNI